jgi:putative ABC transport system permease protein
MSLTSFVVCKNWASSRLRILLTLLGVALGCAIVVAIHVMDHNTIQSQLLAQQPERGRVDLEVVPAPGAAPVAAAEVVAAILSRAGVAHAAAYQEAIGVLRHGDASCDVAAFGFAPLPVTGFAHYAVRAGRDLVAADADPASRGVLVAAVAAEALGVVVGSTVTLSPPPRGERTVCENGRLVVVTRQDAPAPPPTSATVVGIVEPVRLGKRNFGQVVIGALDVVAALGPLGPAVYQLQRESGADLDRLRLELRRDFAVQDARGARIGEGADERAFRNGLKVLGGLALLLGMFVVFQTLSHSLVSRLRQLGLLRCLGAGSGAITRIFLFDAVLLGVVGAALGVLLGLGLAWLLKSYHVSSLGLGKAWSTFEVPWFPVGWTALLGVLFTLAGAMFPLIRARQVPALDILVPHRSGGDVDLLRNVNRWLFLLLVLALPLAYLAMTPIVVEEERDTRIVLLQLVGLLFVFGTVLLLAPGITAVLGRLLLLPCRIVFPLGGWLVAQVVARQAGRIAAGVCGLAAVLLALLGLKSLTGALEGEVEQFAARALHSRVFVRAAPMTADEARALGAVPGVASVEAFEGEERGGGFILRGLAVEAAAGRGGPLEGDQTLVHRYSDRSGRTLVASTRLAKAKGWQLGDLVGLRDRNGVPVSYEVIAIRDDSGFDADERAFAVTAPHWMRGDFCVGERSVTNATLRLEPGADPDAVAGWVRERLPAAQMIKTGAWVRGYLQRDVGRDFVLFDLLLALMLVLAGVGLLNGMTIAAIGRVRELGVLRALGMSRKALAGTFVLEGIVVALLSSVLSLVLAVPMASVLVLGMNQVARLDAPLSLPLWWFAAVPPIAVVIGVLASLVPAVRATKRSPSEAVRYE